MSVPAVERPAFPANERQYLAGNHVPKFTRLFVRSQLGRWRLRHLADATETVADELASNAVKHSGGDVIGVRLEQTPTSVIIYVSDVSPEFPVMRDEGPLAESGRGLHIVKALSARTGCERSHAGGKTVWAEIMK